MTVPYYQDEAVTLYAGDCLDVLRELPDCSVDAVVTDPPYDLSFMGKSWDSTGIAFRVETWTECLRVLKPGGHLLSFGGSRTWHRLASAVEDAGFEIRDSIAWLYGSGFPKSLDVAKAIDKAAGAEREAGVPRMRLGDSKPYPYNAVDSDAAIIGERGARLLTQPATDDARTWQGWGTALKPGFEPIVVGRKPLVGTVAANVLTYGTGAVNIDGCRTAPASGDYAHPGNDNRSATTTAYGQFDREGRQTPPHSAGRWPTNVVLDDDMGAVLDRQSGSSTSPPVGSVARSRGRNTIGTFAHEGRAPSPNGHGDSGGASRFFPTFRYEAKAPQSERPRGEDGAAHPTVKPLDLMRWLVRLVTPPGGMVLEPFAGSGTTIEACLLEGMRCVAIERHEPYLPLIVQRISKPLQPGLFSGGAG